MAGRKGMRHARPRNEAERDMHALLRIEQLYDAYIEKHMLNCVQCQANIPMQDVPPQAIAMLNKRYDKLKATKTENTVLVKSSFIDALKRIEDADRNIPQPQSTDSPRVTH